METLLPKKEGRFRTRPPSPRSIYIGVSTGVSIGVKKCKGDLKFE